MLSKDKFIKAISYLKGNYINWNFDLDNNISIMAWYTKFYNLSDDDFQRLVEKYTTTHKYPPNSPVDLIEVLDEELNENILSPNEAFEKYREIAKKNGGLYYCKDRVISALEKKYPLIAKTVNTMVNELSTWQTSDVFVPKQFKEQYSYFVDKEKKRSKANAISGGDSLKITTNAYVPKQLK